jgi:hypothetical protein
MVHAAWERHKYMKKPARDFSGITKVLVITITDDYFNLFAYHAMPADWNQYKDEYPQKLHYHIFKLVGSIIDSQGSLKTVCCSIHNAQDGCHARAKSVKKDLWEYFERLEKEEMQSTAEEKKRKNTRRKTSDMERKRNGIEPKQDQKER